MQLNVIKNFNTHDIGNVALEYITNQSIENIKKPLRNISSVFILARESEGIYSIDFSAISASVDKSFNTVAVFDDKMELLAYYFYPQVQNSSTLQVISKWTISVEVERQYGGAEESDITYHDIYKEHVENTDYLYSFRPTYSNNGTLNTHTDLEDADVVNLKELKKHIDTYEEDRNGYLASVIGLPTSGVSIDSDKTIYVGSDSIYVNEGNQYVNVQIPKLNNNADARTQYLVFNNSFSHLEPLTINTTSYTRSIKIRPLVYRQESSTLIQTLDSSGYPLLYIDDVAYTKTLAAPNFELTGNIGKVMIGPKYPSRLLEFYWNISNRFKKVTNNDPDSKEYVTWSSPVPLYSGVNDAIVYSLLNMYRDKGYIDNIIIDNSGSQEAILFLVKYRNYGENYIELPVETLYTFYRSSNILLPNFKERKHEEAEKLVWSVYSQFKKGDVLVPKSDVAETDDMFTIGTEAVIKQIRGSVTMCGNMFEEIILPLLPSSNIEYGFFNTGLLISNNSHFYYYPYFPHLNKITRVDIPHNRLPCNFNDIDFIYVDNSYLVIVCSADKNISYIADLTKMNTNGKDLKFESREGQIITYHGITQEKKNRRWGVLGR